MIHIDKKRALELLHEVVKGKEDFQYIALNGCWYARGNKPSCAIGQALFKAGVPISELCRMDSGINGTSTVINNVVSSYFSLTPEARGIFSEFQHLQDIGTPWGEALRIVETWSEP